MLIFLARLQPAQECNPSPKCCSSFTGERWNGACVCVCVFWVGIYHTEIYCSARGQYFLFDSFVHFIFISAKLFTPFIVSSAKINHLHSTSSTFTPLVFSGSRACIPIFGFFLLYFHKRDATQQLHQRPVWISRADVKHTSGLVKCIQVLVKKRLLPVLTHSDPR